MDTFFSLMFREFFETFFATICIPKLAFILWMFGKAIAWFACRLEVLICLCSRAGHLKIGTNLRLVNFVSGDIFFSLFYEVLNSSRQRDRVNLVKESIWHGERHCSSGKSSLSSWRVWYAAYQLGNTSFRTMTEIEQRWFWSEHGRDISVWLLLILKIG